MEMTLIVCGVLTVGIVWFVISPRLAEQSDWDIREIADTEQGLLDQRERCVQVLRDLELDFQTNKIVESDYQIMRQQVSAELGLILQRIDQIRGHEKSASHSAG